MADAICMGELQINFVPGAAGTNLLTVFHKAPDGAPANVAVSLARPGFESALMGRRAGEDSFGQFLFLSLSEAGDAPPAPERLAALCRFANAAGALATTQGEATPALPTWVEAMALVGANPIPSVQEMAP
jgi:sugar/nucleoside kinase (ribokinase family)